MWCMYIYEVIFVLLPSVLLVIVVITVFFLLQRTEFLSFELKDLSLISNRVILPENFSVRAYLLTFSFYICIPPGALKHGPDKPLKCFSVTFLNSLLAASKSRTFFLFFGNLSSPLYLSSLIRSLSLLSPVFHLLSNTLESFVLSPCCCCQNVCEAQTASPHIWKW